jgi:hypothetical protein
MVSAADRVVAFGSDMLILDALGHSPWAIAEALDVEGDLRVPVRNVRGAATVEALIGQIVVRARSRWIDHTRKSSSMPLESLDASLDRENPDGRYRSLADDTAELAFPLALENGDQASQDRIREALIRAERSVRDGGRLLTLVYCGLGPEQIAAETGLTRNQARVYPHRAREAAKQVWPELLADELERKAQRTTRRGRPPRSRDAVEDQS